MPSLPRKSGTVDDHLAVEASGTQERRVENVGPVGGRNEDDALVRFESVHFDQKLVQRLFTFVVPASQTRSAVSSDRVDFVDENDARRAALSLVEQVANARGPDADEHFYEIRA